MRNRYLTALMLAPICTSSAWALDGGTLRVTPRNGWQAFEIISIGEDVPGDGFDWAMPGTFDGLGAWLPDNETLRIQVNHEIFRATISEVNLDLNAFRQAIVNTIGAGDTGGLGFVASARRAYERWSPDGGTTWIDGDDRAETNFTRFCSGQSYAPDTFGPGRGFVDHVYVTGEESFGNPRQDRLFALDLANRDFYQLSDVTGSAAGGIGGMPRDSWENAALVDTGETNHIALLLSPDGGSENMQLYIGEKGRGLDGAPADDFLARNGLAYGSYYFLNDELPTTGTSTDGTFDTTAADALNSTKLEDIDTSPVDPMQVVLGDQDSGLFTFDFDFDFSGGAFNAATSSFSITKVLNHINDVNNSFGDADNVDWSDATTLGGVEYADGLIFVNEDNGNNTGEVWMTTPDGAELTKIADTADTASATETSGILDISALVGYRPASVLLTNNQGSASSLSVLINPDATPLVIPEPSAAYLLLLGAAVVARLRRR